MDYGSNEKLWYRIPAVGKLSLVSHLSILFISWTHTSFHMGAIHSYSQLVNVFNEIKKTN